MSGQAIHFYSSLRCGVIVRHGALLSLTHATSKDCRHFGVVVLRKGYIKELTLIDNKHKWTLALANVYRLGLVGVPFSHRKGILYEHNKHIG